MGTITITVNVDKQECIRQGLAYTGDRMPVAVDLEVLTIEERQELADICDGSQIRTYVYSDGAYASASPRCLPTLDGLRQMLQQAIARRKVLAEKQKIKEETAIAEATGAAEKALQEPLETWLRQCVGWVWEARYPYCTSHTLFSVYTAVPGIQERYAEAQAEAKRRNAEAKAEAERREKEQAHKKAHGIERLHQWAVERGSELLRARIEEDFEWLKLAENEFVRAHMPVGFRLSENVDSSEERRKPTLTEITALRKLRASIPADSTIYQDPRLTYNKIDAKWDDEREEEIPARAYCTLDLTITTPNGETYTVEKVME